MRRAVLPFALLLATACGRTPPDEGPADGAATTAGLNPSSFPSTERWLRSEIAQIESIRSKRNDIALRDASDALATRLSAQKGKAVEWELPVESVSAAEVRFTRSLVSSPKAHTVWLVVSVEAGETVPSGLARTYEGDDFGLASVGAVVPKERAARLAKGDRLRVTGTIARCDRDGYSEATFCNIVLVRAKSHQ